MARKKLGEMSAEELLDTLKWYEGQSKYIRFLLSEMKEREGQ